MGQTEVTLLLLFFVLTIALSYEYFERKTGVAVFPTMPRVGRKIIEILKRDAQSRTGKPYAILDLGSGSGQLAWKIARAMPQAHITGLELAYLPWLRSVVRRRLFGPSNLTYKRLDFWPYDTSSADAVVTYLPGRIMDRVGEKLRKELKPGTLVIANTFPLRADWVADETLSLRAPFKTNVFVYRQA
jgi:trans-aconitate methyltransferase